jgi:hypothetical protein
LPALNIGSTTLPGLLRELGLALPLASGGGGCCLWCLHTIKQKYKQGGESTSISTPGGNRLLSLSFLAIAFRAGLYISCKQLFFDNSVTLTAKLQVVQHVLFPLHQFVSSHHIVHVIAPYELSVYSMAYS